jgi:hypothetical protein
MGDALARKPRFKLTGPLEKDLQAWILASLGAEQKELRVDKRQRRSWVSRGVWLASGCVWWRANSAVLRTPSGGMLRAGVRGMADIGGIVDGRSVWLEVKRPGEKQQPDQVEWQRWVEAAGGVYAVVTSPSEARGVVARIREQSERDTERLSAAVFGVAT